MPMDINQQKEQFSLAYIHAVASATGYSVYDPRVDDQSVDIGLMGYEQGTFCDDPRLEVQAKCTGAPVYINGNTMLSFPLKRKNYEDLRKNTGVPRILVVMVVPTLVNDWLIQSGTDLTLKHCGYWTTLRGLPPIDDPDQETLNVHLPVENMFCSDAIRDIMQRIADGRQP